MKLMPTLHQAPASDCCSASRKAHAELCRSTSAPGLPSVWNFFAQIFASLALCCLYGLKSHWLFRKLFTDYLISGVNTSLQFTSLFSFLQSMYCHLKLCFLLFYYFIVYLPQRKNTRSNRICLVHCWILESEEECLSLNCHSVKEKVRESRRKAMETGVSLLSP